MKITPKIITLTVSILIQLLSQSTYSQTVIRPPETSIQPSPAQPPPKKVLDKRQLEQIVRNAVNDYTREILEIIGDAYQVRYNIREGLLQSRLRLGNYESESILQSTADYQNGLANGRTEGLQQGKEAGLNSANSTSYSIASSEINSAIDTTLNTGAPIEFKSNPQMVLFSGASPNVSLPSDIETRWRANESSKNSQIRQLLRKVPPSSYTNGLFKLSDLFQSHNTQIPSDFRNQYAFRSWLDNDLGTYSSSANEARKFYKEITNDSLFNQASENANLFRSAFDSHYSGSASFERQWNNKVTAPHYGALNLGAAIYTEAASTYARDRGYYKSFMEVFTPSSIEAYNKTYLDYYRANFNSIENRVRTMPLISEVEATIVSEDGKTEFTYGDTFNVVVSRIANRGMVADDVVVDIPTQGQVTSFKTPKTIRVNGLTRITESQVFARLGWISLITAADQLITVSARINNKVVNFTVRATYEELVRKSAQTDSAELSQYLMSLALPLMKKQFDELTGFNDQYEKRDPSMLLVRVRKLFDSLNEAERAHLRTHGQLIRDVFGGKPIRFLNPKRDEWDSAQAMINEMGLAGVVPEFVAPPPVNNHDSPN